MGDAGRLIGVLLIAFWIVFYVGYCGHLYATCKGHVLKNSLDWSVCVQ